MFGAWVKPARDCIDSVSFLVAIVRSPLAGE